MSVLTSISKECHQCKGACWVPNNQSQTQENAKKLFGTIPNKCVNSSNNIVQCPAALGLL